MATRTELKQRRSHIQKTEETPPDTPPPNDEEDNHVAKNPDFSMKDIRSLIPAELFQRSYIKSFSWLFQDFVLILIMYAIAINFLNAEYVPFITLRIALWCLWWYMQGAFFTGVWVVAHECGHNGFSPNKLMDNIVGFILHTMLLVPYFSWQYTHGQHHARTNNLETDTVHQPRIKYAKNAEDVFKPRNRGIFDRLQRILKLSILGWPLYLLFDVSGPPSHDDISWVNHFNPYCAYFPNYMVNLVLLNDIGLIFWCWCLFRLCKLIGLSNFIFYYFIPYLWTNHWLVIITFLQHTDWNIDRYKPCEWSWLRGAFGTIDRNYGWFLNYSHHHIQDSHVIHHLFSKMPHYNAIKATKYLENSEFNKYYMKSNETWYGALWNIVGRGRWTKKNENILQIKK